MKLSKTILAIASALALSVTAFAQPANLSILASKEALMFDLGRKVKSGTVEISSSTLVGGTIKKTVAMPSTLSLANLSVAVDATSNGVTVTLTNPDDYVSTYVSLRDDKGLEIFSGGGGAKSVLSGGVRSLPTIENNIWMAWQTSVPVGDNVVSASIIRTDPLYGYTLGTEDVPVSKGNLLFQTQWAGQGILVLNTSDGKSTNYDLRQNGVKVVASAPMTVLSKSAFAGVFTASNPTAIVRTIPTYQGQGQNEAYEVTMSTMTWVKVSVTTSESTTGKGENPVGYWVRFPGQGWQFTKASETSPEISIQAPAGVTEVYPLWLPEDLRPYDNTGKN